MENWIKRIFLAITLIAGSTLNAAAAEDDKPLIEPDVKPIPVDEALIDTENFEIGFFTGVINIEDFETSFLYGARLAYHLSEDFFFETNIGFAEGGETSAESFIGNLQLLSDEDRKYQYYNLSMGFNLLPGEGFFARKYAYNTNFYLVGGVGATSFADDNRLTYNFGVGYQVLINDALAIHFNAREHIYDIDLLGEDKISWNTELSLGLSVFF